MGTVFTWTADLQTYDMFTPTGTLGNFSWQTGKSRPGTTYCLHMLNNYLAIPVPERQDYYVRWVTYVESWISDNGAWISLVAPNGRENIMVVAAPQANQWRVFRANTGTLLTSAGPCLSNQPVCMEIYGQVANSGGRVIVKQNGTTLIDYTGDTYYDGGEIIQQVKVCASSGGTGRQYLSELVVRDDAWPGQGRVQLLTIDGAGSYSDWTGAYTDVDEIPPSSSEAITHDADTSGGKSSFAHTSMATPAVINSVHMAMLAKTDKPGGGTLRQFWRYDGSDYNGNSHFIGDGDGYFSTIWDSGPDGLAFSKAKIDASEIGVETI